MRDWTSGRLKPKLNLDDLIVGKEYGKLLMTPPPTFATRSREHLVSKPFSKLHHSCIHSSGRSPFSPSLSISNSPLYNMGPLPKGIYLPQLSSIYFRPFPGWPHTQLPHVLPHLHQAAPAEAAPPKGLKRKVPQAEPPKAKPMPLKRHAEAELAEAPPAARPSTKVVRAAKTQVRKPSRTWRIWRLRNGDLDTTYSYLV